MENEATYPFHTAVTDDGVERVGLFGHVGRERIYEFVDPAEHSDYARGRDPRDGDVLSFDTVINYAVAHTTGPMLPIMVVPADEWAAARDEYADGDWGDIREFIDRTLDDIRSHGSESQ